MVLALLPLLVACGRPHATPLSSATLATSTAPPTLAAMSSQPPEPSPYFPPATFPERVDAFVAGWYSMHLTVMHEPSLWSAARKEHSACRFLSLRTWGPPLAVRIENRPSGPHLVATRLTGSGGYEPGEIDVQRERDLTAAEWERVELDLSQASFDTTPTEGAMGSTDGAQWVIERAKDSQYRLVERCSPEPGGPDAAFRRACEVFFDLAGRDLVTGDIY